MIWQTAIVRGRVGTAGVQRNRKYHPSGNRAKRAWGIFSSNAMPTGQRECRPSILRASRVPVVNKQHRFAAIDLFPSRRRTGRLTRVPGFALIASHLWVLLLPGIALGAIASIRLWWIHRKHLKVPARSGLSGAEAARRILDDNGLAETPIVEIHGHLTDHYDLLKRRLCLSSENHRGRSISAIGIAAHEAGHALQHRDRHWLFRMRMKLIPILNLATPLSALLILVGLTVTTSAASMALPAGIMTFTVATLLHLLMLPIEFDASKRAREQLERLGLVSNADTRRIAAVLDAAAMTYVAGLVDFGVPFSFKKWK